MKIVHELTPSEAGWRYLTTSVYRLDAGDDLQLLSEAEETVLVLVAGEVSLTGDGLDAHLTRQSPFAELVGSAYVPPRHSVVLHAHRDSEVALGKAPAEGRYPARLVEPAEMVSELRGGEGARRQVVGTYGTQFPAERLISYEAWVPRSCWTGWPPHRHDGLDGSPYLEETYYYHFDQPGGFGVHRNFDLSRGREELVALQDATLVPVPRDYHLCAVGPPANAWIVNFLAGSPSDRARPPLFDPQELWIDQEWDGASPARQLTLPAVEPIQQH